MKHIAIATTAVLLTISNTALAEGFYAGFGLDAVQIEEEDSGSSDFPLGRRLYVGFETSRRIGFEAVYLRSNLTEADETDDSRTRFSGVAVYGAGSTKSGELGRVLARLGLFTGNREVRSSVRNIDSSTSGFALGLGYALDLGDHVSLRGDFDAFFLSDFDALSSVSLGIQFRFGD